MNYIFIIITAITMCIVLAVIFKLNPKLNKKLVENEELNNIAKKFPKNVEICKSILKKLNNENVTIEEDDDAKDCLYIVVTNKIVIAGTQTNFTRIQTIAHECIHSIQDKRIQMSNFIISNICILYFIATIMLCIFGIIPDSIKMLILTIYILLGFFSFIIRAYLENDAMIKAEYIAKEYMEELNISSKEEREKLVDGFKQINNNGIKGVNFSLMLSILMKTIVLAFVLLVI